MIFSLSSKKLVASINDPYRDLAIRALLFKQSSLSVKNETDSYAIKTKEANTMSVSFFTIRRNQMIHTKFPVLLLMVVFLSLTVVENSSAQCFHFVRCANGIGSSQSIFGSKLAASLAARAALTPQVASTIDFVVDAGLMLDPPVLCTVDGIEWSDEVVISKVIAGITFTNMKSTARIKFNCGPFVVLVDVLQDLEMEVEVIP